MFLNTLLVIRVIVLLDYWLSSPLRTAAILLDLTPFTEGLLPRNVPEHATSTNAIVPAWLCMWNCPDGNPEKFFVQYSA